MNLYVTIIRTKHQSLTRSISFKDRQMTEKHKSGHIDLIKSHLSVMRMNIANFSRYAFIQKAKHSRDIYFDLLFFSPCEELGGANMLQRISSDYDTIKPFLEKINSEFINKMNHFCKNMIKYLN